MDVFFDHPEDVAPGIKTFWFRSNQKHDYTAGQYIELYLPHNNADSRGQKRWFTLSSSPSEQLLAVTTKAASKCSTFKQQLFNLKPGDKARISQPMGDFVLPKDSSLPLVFVASGVGITPIRSMIKWLSDHEQRRSLQLIYGIRSIEQAAFRDLILKYGVKTDLVVSQPTKTYAGLTGRIDVTLITKLVPDYKSKPVFISGPEKFVETLAKELKAAGMPPEQLILDFYHGYDST
jgi:glycine betaine catabolism B